MAIANVSEMKDNKHFLDVVNIITTMDFWCQYIASSHYWVNKGVHLMHQAIFILLIKAGILDPEVGHVCHQLKIKVL